MVFITQKSVRNITLMLLLSLISPLIAKDDDDDDNTLYIQYAKALMTPFIAECENEYQLECIGTGGSFTYNVASITMRFVAYRRGTIEEARALEVKMIKSFLEKINSHEKIRPFLDNYPFKPDAVSISTSFQKEDDSHYADDVVSYVSQIRGKLCYYKADPKTGKLSRILEEPYEEASRIVHATPGEMKKKDPSAAGKIKV